MALDRWIEVRVWIQVRKSRWLREVEGASGARWLWTIIQVKGIDVGNYIFLLFYATYSYESRMGV